MTTGAVATVRAIVAVSLLLVMERALGRPSVAATAAFLSGQSVSEAGVMAMIRMALWAAASCAAVGLLVEPMHGLIRYSAQSRSARASVAVMALGLAILAAGTYLHVAHAPACCGLASEQPHER